MLEFWYSERCTRPVRLVVCITLCVAIFLSSHLQKLSPTLTFICLAIGVTTHFIRQFTSKIDAGNPYQTGFQMLSTIFPLMSLILVILLLPQFNYWALATQAIAFSGLGLCIVSIYQNRARRA
ncbi:hypothetical protein QE380_002613 [Acinetobacter baylyi]|uniref:Uncharacterized protein n=1 Tax=Acinetobacter baylyi TaxID=202950 RepID=A0ABU0UYQ2_ACIBI|nr:hypothetical protein [Acinetobacter baylyi]MDQ1209690.1 hypothetical protein [Acinetobacter baylyi]MDR6106714.1 hypothetical protein [Acinetobacter baylyi]MDR6186560.1 hypothetical protein [Acinetobacter baylyi]